MVNYYDVLGVLRDATEAVIRDRFRILARDCHPDRFTEPAKKQEAEARFQLLTEAVNVLTSETRRKAHDFDLNRGSDPGTHDAQAVAKVYLAKGVKAYKDGDFPQAVSLFDMAVKHNAKDAKAMHYLGLACLKVPGQVRKGVEAVEAALKIEPHNGIFHRDAGKLYKMAGMMAKAERHFEDAVKWNPEDAEAQRLFQEMRPSTESKRILGNLFGRKG